MSDVDDDQPTNNVALLPSDAVLQLWIDIGNGLDQSSTVNWKSAKTCLSLAKSMLKTSESARNFVEKYMTTLIGILLAKQLNQIPTVDDERFHVQKCLELAADIVVHDLMIQIARNGDCRLLSTLAHLFDRKKRLYNGQPKIREGIIVRFFKTNGFQFLHTYMEQKTGTPSFPHPYLVHHILTALADSLQFDIPPPPPSSDATARLLLARVTESKLETIWIAHTVMKSIKNMENAVLKKMPADHLSLLLRDLQDIFDLPIIAATGNRITSTLDFYKFWMTLVLRLITSSSKTFPLPLKNFGYSSLHKLIQACTTDHDHRRPVQQPLPPFPAVPRFFTVTGAGLSFVNGTYEYAGPLTPHGYAYVRHLIPGGEEGQEKQQGDSTGHIKKLTVFRCTMLSQQKWWFISQADEEQPGTDRDIDYYHHKCKGRGDEPVPPFSGWMTCRSAGLDPPPQLEAHGGCMLPPGTISAGDESNNNNTILQHLLEWVIDNEVVEKLAVVINSKAAIPARQMAACSAALCRLLLKEGQTLRDEITERFLRGNASLLPADYHLLENYTLESLLAKPPSDKYIWLAAITQAHRIAQRTRQSEYGRMRKDMANWLATGFCRPTNTTPPTANANSNNRSNNDNEEDETE